MTVYAPLPLHDARIDRLAGMTLTTVGGSRDSLDLHFHEKDLAYCRGSGDWKSVSLQVRSVLEFRAGSVVTRSDCTADPVSDRDVGSLPNLVYLIGHRVTTVTSRPSGELELAFPLGGCLCVLADPTGARAYRLRLSSEPPGQVAAQAAAAVEQMPLASGF